MVYPKYCFVVFKYMLLHENLILFSVYFLTFFFPDQNRLHGVWLSYFEYEIDLEFGGKDMYRIVTESNRIVTESNMQNSRNSCICLAVSHFVLPKTKAVCTYLIVFKHCNSSAHMRKIPHQVWRKNIGKVSFSAYVFLK